MRRAIVGDLAGEPDGACSICAAVSVIPGKTARPRKGERRASALVCPGKALSWCLD